MRTISPFTLFALGGAAALALCAGEAPAEDPFVITTHERRIQAQATVDFVTQMDSETAPDDELWSTSVEAMVVAGSCSASATAGQTSIIGPSRLFATGTASAEVVDQVFCTTSAVGNSRYELEFTTNRTWYVRLRGSLAGGNQNGIVELDRGGVVILRHEIDGEKSAFDFDDVRRLIPAAYHLRAETTCFSAEGNCGLFSFAFELAGDFNGDGRVVEDDLVALLTQWGDCAEGEKKSGCATDLDGDGRTAFSDLLRLLSNWYEG